MRRKKIGVMDFHGSVDITDPCYDKDVWCRMNDVKISDGEYTCNVWHHTDKGTYKDGTPYSYILVGAIGIYRNGDIPRQKDMEKIGSIGVDAGLAGFFHNKPDYSDEAWSKFCDRIRHGDAWLTEDGFYSSSGYPRNWGLRHGTPLHNIARYIWGKTPESPLYDSSREDLLSVARCSGTGNVLFIMQSLRFAPCSHWAAA